MIFTRAIQATTETLPTSRQARALAAAFNDRILSGLGDWAWRIAWYLAAGLWRQVRNPDASGLVFPPQNEVFEIYHGIDPDRVAITSTEFTVWPVAAPGANEGANLANPLMAHKFGNPGVVSESESLLVDFPLSTPGSLFGAWELGKAQRGGHVMATGEQNWPAGEAAERFFLISSAWWSPHGKSWGGFLPTPEILADHCGSTAETGLGIPSYQYRYTALRDDVTAPAGHHGTAGTTTIDGETRVTITYSGSCPCWSEDVAVGHALGQYRLPLAYLTPVVTNAGTCAIAWDSFPRSDWVVGPYAGEGRLEHTDGEHLRRVMQWFVSDFRGRPEQRNPDTFRIQSIALPFQELMTRQWPLAPARAVLVEDEIEAVYPSAEFTGDTTIDSGTLGDINGAGTSYAGAEGCVIAGVYAGATELTAPCRVEIMDGDEVLVTLRLTPEAPEAMHWFEVAARPTALKFRLADDATFQTTAGGILVEAAELVEMQPQHWDVALLARIAGSNDNAMVDGRGVDTDWSAQMGAEFMARGCIIGDGPHDEGNSVNENPVYDSARRMTAGVLKILNRRQFVAYEVAGGKSILYLKRFAYGMHNSRVDLLDGIAPPIDPVYSIVEGESYVVRATSGGVTYSGTSYTNGQTFTGGAAATFTATGDAEVYVHDGIRHTALKRGWTNRWCSFVESKCYHPSNSSIWKPSAYTDYFGFCDRCHFRSGTLTNPELRRQVSFNYGTDVDPENGAISRLAPRVQAGLYAPEAPTGYRYALGANNTQYTTAVERHRKSCRIYEPPIEVESCVVDDWSADQVVKLTFTGRFQSHPDAPSTWSKTPPVWDEEDPKPSAVEDLEDEVSGEDGFRTIDNALREYHVHQSNEHYNCKLAIGDYGGGSGTPSDAGKPYGSCYPTLFLVKLIPEPYEDDNETWERHDSRMVVDPLVQSELYLRAGCEGWIDGQASLDYICATGTGNLYDYTFENLCLDAFGGSEIGCLPEGLRPDASGHGPLPNTRIHAEVFNRLVSCVNLLTKARLEIQTTRYSKTTVRFDEVSVSIGPGSCGAGGAWQDNVAARSASTIQSQDADWVEDGGMSAGQIDEFSGCPYTHATTVQTFEWKVVVPDGVTDALPPALRSHVSDLGVGIAANIELITTRFERSTTTTPGQPCGDSSPCHPFYDGTNYHEWEPIVETEETCVLMSSGSVTAPTPPNSDYWVGGCGGGQIECRGGASTSVSVTPFAVQMPFVEVPLEDLP